MAFLGGGMKYIEDIKIGCTCITSTCSYIVIGCILFILHLRILNHSNITIASEVLDWHVWLQRIEKNDHYCVLLAEGNGF